METCTEEVGLLRKKPCGKAMVTHCANCEQPLCTDHAVAVMTETGRKSGKFMCKACLTAQKEYAKTLAAATEKKGAPAPAPAAAAKPATPPPAKPAAPAAKPAAPAAPPPAAAKAPPPAAAKPGEKKPLSLEDTGPLEFTPGKPPEEKK